SDDETIWWDVIISWIVANSPRSWRRRRGDAAKFGQSLWGQSIIASLLLLTLRPGSGPRHLTPQGPLQVDPQRLGDARAHDHDVGELVGQRQLPHRPLLPLHDVHLFHRFRPPFFRPLLDSLATR